MAVLRPEAKASSQPLTILAQATNTNDLNGDGMAKHELYTTGYSGFCADDFLWKVSTFGIETIVDIRDNPRSRNAAFTQSRLQPYLEEHGIRYVHFEELGVPRELRESYRKGLERTKYFTRYRKHLDGKQAALDSLAKLMNDSICCLLCLESKAEDCHRSVLADVLASRNGKDVEVNHI